MWISTAMAEGEAASNAAKQPTMIENMIPLIFIFVVMYFILIRPQAKKAKEHANLLKTIKAGDEVITSGGIIGRIKSVAEEFVTIDIGNSQLKILKEHISNFTKPHSENSTKTEKSQKKSKSMNSKK